MHFITDYVNKATKRLPHRHPLGQQETEIRNLLWTDLLHEGNTLTSQGLRIRSAGLPRPVKDRAVQSQQWLHTLGNATAQFVRVLSGMETKDTGLEQRVNYKVGIACPGRTGFTDAAGRSTNLRPLMDPETGIVWAMQKLDLDVVGLPGARMNSEVRPLGVEDFNIYGKWQGGTSYASVAALWRRQRVSYTVREDISCNREIWGILDGGPPLGMHICYIYFSANDNDALVSELRKLSQNLKTLKARNGKLERTIIPGDFNSQPTGISGVVETRTKRVHEWTQFKEEWRLVITNPTFHGEQPQPIWLPKR